MSIQINVPLDTLQRDPAVADAVRALVDALARRRGPGRPAGSTSARPAAKAPAAPRAKGAAPKPSASKKPRTRKARTSAADTSKKFIDLLRERGPLTTPEALKALGLSDPRALGGMVGSMNRWSVKQTGAPKIKVATGAGGEKTYSMA